MARMVKKWRHDSSSARILYVLFLWEATGTTVNTRAHHAHLSSVARCTCGMSSLLCSVAGKIYVQMTFILSYKLMSCFYQPEPVYGPVHVYVVQEPKKVVRYQKSSVV
jgi:hypothetical protein